MGCDAQDSTRWGMRPQNGCVCVQVYVQVHIEDLAPPHTPSEVPHTPPPQDDSMHIAEPRQDNSGLPQGVFVKRHKVTKDDGSFFSPADFLVGQELHVYAKTLFLVDADEYTREWCKANLGRDLDAPLGYPDDPVEDYRATFGMNRGRKSGGN